MSATVADPKASTQAGDHLAGLNPAQREAATFGLPAPQGWDADPLLILAGAGSGKTQTLSHRAAHLVLAGVDPRRILLLTFSRRAAEDMTRRAHAICESALASRGRKGQGVRLPWAGTFHAVGARLLREYAPRLGIDEAFSILDRADAADLLDVARHDAGLAGRPANGKKTHKKRFPRKDTCLAIYSATVNRQAPLAEVLERWFGWCSDHHDDLKRLFADYTARKQSRATLDYDDLLLYWRLVMGNGALADEIGARFDHVLVDEYQDTNGLQAAILQAMKPTGRGLTVVGDDAQAIYGFRAAEIDNILDFSTVYCGTQVVTLEANYRSTQAILDAANTLMGEATRAYAKQLTATRGAGVKPRHVTVMDTTAEARWVVDAVLARRETGVDLKRQAVLFRNGHHANELEIELIRRNVPFRKYGGLKFLEAAHVKDFLGLIRWADNPRHEIAAWRAMQIVPGVGSGTARQAFEALEAAGDRIEALADFRPARADRDAWRAMIETVAALAGANTWPSALAPAATWYKAQLDDRFEAPNTARAGDIDDLARIGARYGDAPGFLTELTLDPPQATGDHNDDALLDEDYLILSTVHSAKGQEWDSVHVLHIADGTFPNEFSTKTEAGLEEERRLLYVAMTRAKNELSLISPLRYYVTQQAALGDAHVYGANSRFLTPAVMACFDSIVDTPAGAHDGPTGRGHARSRRGGGRALAVARRVVHWWAGSRQDLTMTETTPAPSIDLAVFDIDGTLIDARNPLSEHTIKALRGLREAGIGVALASSRQRASLVDIAAAIGLEMPLIPFNGTLVTAANGTPIAAETFTPGDALTAALAAFVDAGGCIHAYAKDRWHAYGQAHRIVREAAGADVTPDLRAERLDAHSLPESLLKIMCDGTNDELAGVRAAVAAQPELVISWSGNACHDVHLASATKGHALRVLCEHLDVELAHVAAFGDADSDITMLANAGYGYAMGDAGEQVRAAAGLHLDGPGSGALERLLVEIAETSQA